MGEEVDEDNKSSCLFCGLWCGFWKLRIGLFYGTMIHAIACRVLALWEGWVCYCCSENKMYKIIQ